MVNPRINQEVAAAFHVFRKAGFKVVVILPCPPLANCVLTFKNKHPRVVCKYCEEEDGKNTTRQARHLTECPPYLRAKGRNSSGTQTTLTERAHRPVVTMTAEEKRDIDESFALALFMTNSTFSFPENEYVQEFLKKLNPAYKSAARMTFSTTLLDTVYNRTQRQVQDKLKDLMPYGFNIITDESADINKNRIVSMSINGSRLTFFHKAQDMRGANLTAVNYTNWILHEMDALVDGNFLRINSVATDTCSTMQAVWRLLEQAIQAREPAASPLFVPCDSHGIQLMFKDIVEKIPFFERVSRGVKKIVGFFHGAHLQYGLLKEHQVQIYGKRLSLLSSVITRWGTEYAAAESVFRNKEALRALERNPQSSLDPAIIDLINDRTFWVDLEDTLEVLQPLNENLKMSESDTTHLGDVIPRWKRFLQHVADEARRRAPQDQHAAQNTPPGLIMPLWHFRFERQTRPLHWAAFYLTPINWNHPIENPAIYNQVLHFIGWMEDPVHHQQQQGRVLRAGITSHVSEESMRRRMNG
jgi:hypothetical protein